MSEKPVTELSTPGFDGLVGFSRSDITPPIGIRNRNWGASTSDVATGIHRSFSLSALAFRDVSQQRLLVIVAVDGTHWRRVDDWELLQKKALTALHLEPAQLIFNLSHTHSGPVLTGSHADLAGGEHLARYLEDLAHALVTTCEEAIENLTPGSVDWSTGRSSVAVNRDLDLDGRALVGFNPAMPADDTVLVGRVCAADGSHVATVVNYACHPTTLAWENSDLSPDYIGELRATVESHTSAPCMFLQGASGDLSPRLQYSGDTDLADRHGRAIGLAVLAELETMPPPATDLVYARAVESGAPLAIWEARPREAVTTLEYDTQISVLPLRTLSTEEELELEWAEILPQSRDERLRRVRDLREGYIALDTRPDDVDHPMWVARIGDALLVAHPGEAYSWLQTELRAQFEGIPVVVLNLSNGPGFVYIPDRSAYERDAYQAWQTVFAPGALEKFADDAAAALRSLSDTER